MTTDDYDPVQAHAHNGPRDIDLEEIYPEKNVEEVKEKEEEKYNYGEWE